MAGWAALLRSFCPATRSTSSSFAPRGPPYSRARTCRRMINPPRCRFELAGAPDLLPACCAVGASPRARHAFFPWSEFGAK
jgi:hypothetical protein